jgi:dipeptidase E
MKLKKSKQSLVIGLILLAIIIVIGTLIIKNNSNLLKNDNTEQQVNQDSEKETEPSYSPVSLRNIRLYLGGSGDDMFSQEETAREVIALSKLSKPKVLYIGTCSYDAKTARQLQTNQFIKLGCQVNSLAITRTNPGVQAMEQALHNTDIILISGGNTLWGRDRWVKIGLDKLIKKAVIEGGKVWAGGSAGMILATSGGHSDSMDPSTYLNPPGPLMSPFLFKKNLDTSWAYIRASGLGIVDMISCPHYDKIESNGTLRATSFENMMKMHSGEYGLVIDNWAGIIIDGEKYTLVHRQGKSGSVDSNGHYTTDPKKGKPGSWTISINSENGNLQRSLVPRQGHVNNISKKAKYIVQSQMLSPARKFNPQ